MKKTDYNKLYDQWLGKIEELQQECPHKKISKWTNTHIGYDHRFCLNCMKEMEVREGHYVIVRQRNSGYLFYSDGKWTKTKKKATVFIGESYEEAFNKMYQEYSSSGESLRVMPWTAFNQR